ncbi:MAG: hypothetical protein COY40_01580 [Alphaproteobacteria bacterium CG_4_10_14_0_8_um_filter_53_9]|nr:MAG: hypothetical protein COY40_01580 [Alphaproteobacteria bacterium CG_4_10_14_0_8_um_filter_53_9]
MKTAILGLTGDPTHAGHAAMVNALLAMNYDRVALLIASQNPDKPHAPLPFAHRATLARLAVKDLNGAEIWEDEAALPHGGNNHTRDVLRALCETRDIAGATFVMGADSFASFHLWGGYKEILREHGVLVFPREGALDPYVAVHDVGLVTALHDGDPYTVPPGCLAVAQNAALPDVSSTALRKHLTAGGDGGGFLTAAQLDYIRKQALYAPPIL